MEIFLYKEKVGTFTHFGCNTFHYNRNFVLVEMSFFTFTSELSVMLSARLVATNDTRDLGGVLQISGAGLGDLRDGMMT